MGLYCACVDCCNTTKFLICYCSCIALVRTALNRAFSWFWHGFCQRFAEIFCSEFSVYATNFVFNARSTVRSAVLLWHVVRPSVYLFLLSVCPSVTLKYRGRRLYTVVVGWVTSKVITACAVTSISDVPFQWERRNFDPHSSHILLPIFLKLKTKKQTLDTNQHAKFGKDRFTGGVWANTLILAVHSGIFITFFIFCTLRSASRCGSQFLPARLRQLPPR